MKVLRCERSAESWAGWRDVAIEDCAAAKGMMELHMFGEGTMWLLATRES